MQFLIRAFDHKDAMPRRMESRDAHLALIAQMKAEGRALFGAAMIDDAGEMCGSTLVVDFPSRAEVDAYLASDPYVVNRVWDRIEVSVCKVAPHFMGR